MTATYTDSWEDRVGREQALRRQGRISNIQTGTDKTQAVSTRRCMVCGETGSVTVSSEGVRRWKQGELIQNAMPDLDADQREQLISGTHPDCWGELFE